MFMERYIKIPMELLKMGLSGNALILYGILLNLSFRDDVYATNGYLAKQLNVSVRQIQNLLSELKEYNTISVIEKRGQRLIKPLILCSVYVGSNIEPLEHAPRLSEAPQVVIDFINTVK